ncbi:MAG TPA: thiolase family protein [Burkholderiales bacterium]|nr:thiolase family protein [Burkholderiales bacterium]
MEEYLASRVLSYPVRLLDCVPMVNGGLAYIVTSAKSAATITDKPVYLLGFGEVSNSYDGPHSRPDITYTGFEQTAPEASKMAGVEHRDIDLFESYDDYPMVVLIQMEDYGFCRKGEGAKFVEEHNMRFDGDFPISTDGGQLSGGQPGGAIGCFMPTVEAVTQLRGEAGDRQVKGASVAAASGFGGMTYTRNNRNCVTLILGSET